MDRSGEAEDNGEKVEESDSITVGIPAAALEGGGAEKVVLFALFGGIPSRFERGPECEGECSWWCVG